MYAYMYVASIFLDYNPPVESNIKTLEKVIKFTKGAKRIIAMKSNSRSTIWHEVLTNSRSKLMEEFFASNQLHIINEDSTRTTFRRIKDSSNINLTIVNNRVLVAIKDWEISEEESCSDHNLITFNLNFANNKVQIHNFLGTRYIIKGQQHTEFHKNLLQLISKNFQIENNEGNAKEIDKKLNTKITCQKDTGIFIGKFEETIQSTCKETFKHLNSPNTTAKGKSVPWWTDALKIMRKRTVALRRRNQRTLNNEN